MTFTPTGRMTNTPPLLLTNPPGYATVTVVIGLQSSNTIAGGNNTVDVQLCPVVVRVKLAGQVRFGPSLSTISMSCTYNVSVSPIQCHSRTVHTRMIFLTQPICGRRTSSKVVSALQAPIKSGKIGTPSISGTPVPGNIPSSTGSGMPSLLASAQLPSQSNGSPPKIVSESGKSINEKSILSR